MGGLCLNHATTIADSVCYMILHAWSLSHYGEQTQLLSLTFSCKLLSFIGLSLLTTFVWFHFKLTCTWCNQVEMYNSKSAYYLQNLAGP